MIAARRSHSQPTSSADGHDIAAHVYRVLRSTSKMALEPFADDGRGHAICGALAMAAAVSCAKAYACGESSVGGRATPPILGVVGNGLRPSAAPLVRFGTPPGVRSPLAQFVFWLSACRTGIHCRAVAPPNAVSTTSVRRT